MYCKALYRLFAWKYQQRAIHWADPPYRLQGFYRDGIMNKILCWMNFHKWQNEVKYNSFLIVYWKVCKRCPTRIIIGHHVGIYGPDDIQIGVNYYVR